jgi:putative addiction module CopG family antidote
MSKPITSADLPPHLAPFAEAQVAAGRFTSIEDVVEAGLEALRERTESERLAGLRREAKDAFSALDRGEGIETTPDELVDGIERELDLDSEPLPDDWNDYLRYRFEQGRAAIARGEYSEASPAELMARVRARVEENP